MRSVLPYLVVGLASGSIYAIAGLGLVLTFKTSGVFNFAHGAQAATAAYLFYQVRDRLSLPWPVAAVVSVALAGVVLGIVLERVAAALDGQPLSSKITATVGLLVAIQAAIVLRYGATTIRFRPFLPTRLVHLPDVNVGLDQIVVFLVATAATVGLLVFFKRTRLGVAVQGVVDNSELLELQGTSPTRVRRRAWIIGSCFAAISGLLLAEAIGLDASLLTLLVVQAFGAAAVGAFDSLLGTFAGGMVVGVGAAFATKYLAHIRALRQIPANVPFLVLFIVLVLFPSRLRTRRRGGRERPAKAPGRLPPVASSVGIPLGGLLLLLVPVLVGSRLAVYTEALTFTVLFVSLGLLVNTSGQVSLCHMAFAAVGASTFARALGAGLPWPIALVAAGAVALPVGALVAIPAIRLSGVYLAVATFGFGILVERIFYTTVLMFGAQGVLTPRRPALPGLHLTTERGYYYAVLAVVALCCGAVAAIRKSRLGRLLVALSESPDSLTAHGVTITVTKVLVFTFSAFLAAIGGALAGPVTGSTSNLSFDFSVSLVMVAVLAISGRRLILSAFIAASLYVVIPSYITTSNATTIVQLVFGLLAVAVAVAPALRMQERITAWRRASERTVIGPIAARSIAVAMDEAPA